MEFKYYQCFGGKAIPVNPYQKETPIKYPDGTVDLTHYNSFDKWAKENTVSCSEDLSGEYAKDLFNEPVWQSYAPNQLNPEWTNVHDNLEWRMEFAKNNGCHIRQYIELKPVEKQPENFHVTTDEKGFFDQLRVFDVKDNLLINWSGSAVKAFCMYDDNDGYQEWNITDTPDRDKANGYRVRECYLAINEGDFKQPEVKQEFGEWISAEHLALKVNKDLFVESMWHSKEFKHSLKTLERILRKHLPSPPKSI